ncbi:MAG TPA: undecaprenyldiphospho-muramoylpentapeptide beta-N-acetylglucosaminyltransferase [Candidatus Hydrogenedentes bacterium]|nr:undecaprenyldiphospho-muramoylpentapeptide beta-N-acetylglucosaminyltransferase [Candidatus Hydrogenedentota bacterium]HOJ68570.1 undecaprenyldiphospho-muramoylpentapeptide beta-N-acetylglucosaminyltransferase [Candidatus Hydrogenedentota bacterium]HOK90835.1 undecaprenyldiphospho-muramoylpentapeptide beta-N-acetylglucosaminyltransferase [Candidatus Hydrogenedentota bacterium]
MRIMIAGGGTGGHVTPALAIVEELRRRDPLLELTWVGRAGGLEERMCRAADIVFRGLPIEGWTRSRSPRVAVTALKLGWSITRCYFWLHRFQPRAVIGVGGYASLPLVWTAQRMGIPTFIHEQNRRMGLANRLCADRARMIFLSYADTLGPYPRERAVVTGNPVRRAFLEPPSREEALARMDLSADLPVVLVCGGSQGARSLNRAMEDLLRAGNAPRARYLWMCGRDAVQAARQVAETASLPVRVFSFIDDMPAACVAADLVVSRAGASSTAELAALGKPAILVPYPHAADNHQELNARAFEEAGAAVLIPDAACDADRLGSVLRELLADPARLAAMAEAARSLARPLAAETIVERILESLAGMDHP